MNQAANTVVRLPSTRPQARPHTTKRAAKALRRRTITAYFVGGVAVALTALSLHDLAEGVRIVTHGATWQSYAMASGIDPRLHLDRAGHAHSLRQIPQGARQVRHSRDRRHAVR
jgi:hypothetical protein